MGRHGQARRGLPWLAVACAVAVALAGPGTARAERARPAGQTESRVASAPLSAFHAQYVPPVVAVGTNRALVYTNLDIVEHDVVHDPSADGVPGARRKPWCRSFKGACPLFWSPRAGFGESVRVKGLRSLKVDSRYTFYCTLHPHMRGTLVVLP